MCAPSNLAGDQPVTSTRESELRAANSLAACSPYGLHTHYQSEGIALNCTRMASSRWQAVPHCMAHSFAPFENKATSSRRSWTSKHPSKRRDLAAPEGQLVQSLRYDSPICQVATCRAHCSKACINPVQGQLAECCSERTPLIESVRLAFRPNPRGRRQRVRPAGNLVLEGLVALVRRALEALVECAAVEVAVWAGHVCVGREVRMHLPE